MTTMLCSSPSLQLWWQRLAPQAGLANSHAPRLLKTGNFADVEVTCASGGKTWKVHKSFLCPRSDYFLRAFTGGFKARANQSARRAAAR